MTGKSQQISGWHAALCCLLCACSLTPSGTPKGGPDGATPNPDVGPGSDSDPQRDTGGAAPDAPDDDVAAPNDVSAGDIAAADTGTAGNVASWPQAGGPDGTFRVNAEGAPTTWSVAANKNILWRTNLDNEGQGGIAIAGDLLFLTTFLPFSGSRTSLSIEGYAIDRITGTIKWRTKPLVGNGEVSWMADQYSDATSWTPITDGKYVWFFNSAGHMGCWDVAGTPNAAGILAPIWEGDFAGQQMPFPFNRQHEPFMTGNDLVILSPLGKGIGDPAGKTAGWHYLHGIDKMTGKTTWAADDASTFYNTAVMGTLPDGTPAVVHGRGGPHGVLETPVGLSMTSLAPGSMGKSLWQYRAAKAPMCNGGAACAGGAATALYTMSWDGRYAYWFTEPPDEALSVLDATTGKLVHSWPLGKLADLRRWDPATGKYLSMAGVNLNTTADWSYSGTMHVVPSWHANIIANGYAWFLTVTNNNDRWAGIHTGPPHSLGRVNVETGKVEYLELPVGVQRSPTAPEQLVYGRNVATTAMDSKGTDVAMDNVRSHTDGWSIPAFYASPVMIGNKLYFGTTLGITYIIDANAKVLDETAILGYGDLGPLGQTWSLAGPSYAGGVMYHHSSKEVVAIRP